MKPMMIALAALFAVSVVLVVSCESADNTVKSSGDSDSDSDSDSDADSDSDTDYETSTNPADDNDNDGLSNGFEEELGTDPNDDDSDGDGVSDLVEWIAGTDPLDPDSNPGAEGNFYFLVPYNGDPDPPEDTLEFATNIEKADVFFLVDTTGSMSGEITNLTNSLSTYIIPEVQLIIDDVWFGVGRYDDYPVSPFGSSASGDVVFELNQEITSDTGLAQSAVASLGTHFGSDGPESSVPAMYATATGEGFGVYLAPQASCAVDEVGYPCFRPGAIPIIMLITDATFHNGPGDTDMYYGIDPIPPTYSETVDALNAIHAKVLPIYSVMGDGDAYDNCLSIATDTGAVDTSDNPLVFSISGDGTGLDEEVVNAIDTLAHDVPLDMSAVGRDDTSDEVDATIFIDYITPFNEDTAECTGGLVTADIDDDTIDDVFIDVLPGTPVCFDIIPAENTTVEPIDEPQVFMAFIDVIGDYVTILDTRDVYFLVPPDTPLE